MVISPNSLQIVFTGGGLSDVAYIRVHPGYEWKSLNNDIAVVRLLRDVESTYDDVRPICLTDEVSDGSGVIIGREFDAHGKRGNKLVKKAAKAVSHAECVGNHPEFAGFLTDASFCGKYTEGAFLKLYILNHHGLGKYLKLLCNGTKMYFTYCISYYVLSN